MKIMIESTTKIVEFNGVTARVWEGTSESGIKLHCFITRIAVDVNDEAANEQMKRELLECSPPKADLDIYPLKMVL